MTPKERSAMIAENGQYVTFQVGQEEFGLDIRSVAEAIRPLPITRLPHMPEFIEGVIDLRGTLIPVVDLRKRFALYTDKGAAKKERMLIARTGVLQGGPRAGGLLGLIVDAVQEVVDITSRQVDQAPEAAILPGSDFIEGVAKTGGRLVIIINAGLILNRQERQALAETDHA